MSLIDTQRYWQQLMTLGQITDPNQPYTRRSFSDLFLQGRSWLTEQMQAAGLTVHVDAAGNLIGRKVGKKPELGAIMLGSHSDSVPSGGRFDGIAGVIAALECAQALQQHGIELNHDLEIVDFLAEEPSEWGVSCVGSRGLSGYLTPELLQTPHPKTQELLADALARMGGDANKLQVRHDVAAFLELHIEQGLVLEQTQIDIGVVTGIVGIIRLSITFQGQAAHAGTTPMTLRQDALTAAANTIVSAQNLAQEMAARPEGYFVATCGQVHNHPNASNVVPGRTQVVFDIRSDTRGWMTEFVDAMNILAVQHAQAAGVAMTQFERLTDTYPMACDEALMQHIEAATTALGHSQQRMPSGAGHDAAFLAKVAPSAMVFVPSVAGKSHCPEEWTPEADLSKGVAVLMQALLNTDAAAD
ncbi:MAG: Zn-dependent hydrolase [Neisseriaceae bacterium]|nr:Zn-dependent hydrolase [Neisseriaceae bacterium]